MRKLLLSIKPKYVKQIFSGRKKYEYRKIKPNDEHVRDVLIYQSNEVMKVVGEFRIAHVLEGPLQEVWNLTSKESGITKEDFFSYFSGRTLAYAFEISELRVYDIPLELSTLGIKRAPMSFQYIET